MAIATYLASLTNHWATLTHKSSIILVAAFQTLGAASKVSLTLIMHSTVTSSLDILLRRWMRGRWSLPTCVLVLEFEYSIVMIFGFLCKVIKSKRSQTAIFT